jgi:hypothetical protein
MTQASPKQILKNLDQTIDLLKLEIKIYIDLVMVSNRATIAL